MTASDIRAGRAYVEVSTKSSKLVAGLRDALKRVRSFAAEASQVGLRVALGGFGLAGTMTALAKTFAEAGEGLSLLRDRTGLSADALSGLKQAAADSGVEFAKVAKGVTALQKGIASGDAEKALQQLGLSLQSIASMPLSDALGMISDRLAEIEDENRRVAIATELFGGKAAELLPVLGSGSQAMNDAANSARKLGSALDEAGIDSAVQLDTALDELSAAALGLRNSLGEALVPVLVPAIKHLVSLVNAVRLWVKENPQAVQAVLDFSVALGTLGAGVAALATAVTALTSPLVLVTAALAGIIAGALAVTDVLGVTETGFGKMFNAIRIQGQGLATWWAKWALAIGEFWNDAVDVVAASWDWLATEAAHLGDRMFRALIWVPRAILQAYSWLAKQINEVLGTSLGQDADRWIGLMSAVQGGLAQRVDDREAGYQQRSAERVAQEEMREAAMADRLRALDEADPNDGSTGLDFDGGKFKEGLMQLGANVRKSISDAIGGVAEDTVDKLEQVKPFASAAPGALASVATAGQSEVLGTFNASAAGQMGFGSSIQAQQLSELRDLGREMKATRRNTEQMARSLSDQGTYQ